MFERPGPRRSVLETAVSETTRKVQVRGVYDPVRSDDGVRVLIDGIWPRGVRKDELSYDEWLNEVAPSIALRQWFDHDERRFAAFAARYRSELEAPPKRAALDHLRVLAEDGPLTLLTATKNVEHSHATVIANLVRETVISLRTPDVYDGSLELGGEAACWLNLVCPECGLLIEHDSPTRCPRCHRQLSGFMG